MLRRCSMPFDAYQLVYSFSKERSDVGLNMRFGQSRQAHIQLRIHLMAAHVLNSLVKLLKAIHNRDRHLDRNHSFLQLVPCIFLIIFGQCRYCWKEEGNRGDKNRIRCFINTVVSLKVFFSRIASPMNGTKNQIQNTYI